MSVSSTGTCTRVSASLSRRKLAAADHLGADPFGQIGQLDQRLGDRTTQRAQRKPLRQRVDRIDTAELGKAGLVDDAVGMHDLRDAVIHLQGAGDVAFLADRQQLLDIAGLGAEKRQHHVAGLVTGIDKIRRARIARRRRAMAIDGDFQRHHGSLRGIADFRPRPAIDHAGGQMQQQIDQSRRLVAAEQIAQQLVLLRPDAGKARDRSKQGIEQSRAHRSILKRRWIAGSSPATTHPLIICRTVLSSARADTVANHRYIKPARHYVRVFGVGLE